MNKDTDPITQPTAKYRMAGEVMKTEMTTRDKKLRFIWNSKLSNPNELAIDSERLGALAFLCKRDVILLRDFLNQLDLDNKVADIDTAAESYAYTCKDYGYNHGDVCHGFEAGAKWAFNQLDLEDGKG